MTQPATKPAKLPDVNALVAKKLNITQDDAGLAVRAVLDSIKELMLEKGRVQLTGFATFWMQVRPEGMYKKYICKKGEPRDIWRPDRSYGYCRLSGKLASVIEGYTNQPEELARVKALDLPRYNKSKAKMDEQAAKRAIWAAADVAQLEALKAKLLAGEAVGVPDKAIMQAVRDELGVGGAAMDPAVKAGL